jgi:pimeloyl-ACP methyl ester carboxylesterase
MKKLMIIGSIIFLVFAIACTGGWTPIDPNPGGGGTVTTGFPADFPEITDAGGSGAGTILSGFGGDTTKDKAANRAAVTKIPVILLHGNGGNANSAQWGWGTFKGFLKAAGYNDSEIWAVSYLGATNTSADMSDPHRNNIADVRNFIDAVIEYLGVNKVDIVGHSLGAGLAISYIKGLRQSPVGSFDNTNNNRIDKVGTLVTLAGANYGLGSSMSEFQTGGAYERNSHKWMSGTDDTPNGNTDVADDSNERVWYVALWATGDFVDSQNSGTGRLEGAEVNQGYSLGSSLAGHEAILKSQTVFNKLLPFLNKAVGGITPPPPPEPVPPVASINPGADAEFNGSQAVTISATNLPDTIQYSTNGGSTWSTYSGPITITETTTIQAKATNEHGTSPVVSVTLTKSAVPAYETVSATATTHYTSGRLDVSGYIAMGGEYGYINAFNLYKVEGQPWTDVQPQ